MMMMMFNEICINEEMLPKYTYICIYIYIYIYYVLVMLSYIYPIHLYSMYVCMCVCACVHYMPYFTNKCFNRVHQAFRQALILKWTAESRNHLKCNKARETKENQCRKEKDVIKQNLNKYWKEGGNYIRVNFVTESHTKKFKRNQLFLVPIHLFIYSHWIIPFYF